MTYSFATDVSYYLLVLFTSLFGGLLFVPFAGRLALRLGILDQPDARKVHRSPLPRMGGMGMFLAFLATALICVKKPPMVQGVILGATMACFTGLIDDLYRLPPKIKFAGEILAAVVFISVSGMTLHGFGDLFGLGRIEFGPAAGVLTVFCIVGVSNALNLSDGLDGLAGGISAIAFFFLAVLAYSFHAWYALILALAGLGGVLAFLRQNNHPAKIFMGDCGSLFLGFLLGTLSVRLAHGGENSPPAPPVVLATILAVPVADTLWVMAGRLRNGENPFLPDKTHLHHRLLRMGLAHRDVVTVIYVLCAFFGTLGLAGAHWPEWRLFLLALLAVGAVYAILALLENRGINLGRSHNRYAGSSRPRLLRRRLLRLSGRWLPFMLSLSLAALCLPVLFMGANRTIGYFAVACAMLAALLFPWKGGRKEMPMAHGVLALMIYSLVLFYIVAPDRPSWLPGYLLGVEAVMVLWILPRLLFGRRMIHALPSAFELIFILFTWVVPVILANRLGIPDSVRPLLVQSCLLALPILIFLKQTLRRHARRNKSLAGGFILLFLLIGAMHFFG